MEDGKDVTQDNTSSVEFVIRNVPSWLNKKDLSKVLRRSGVDFTNLKKLHGWNYSFIWFPSEQAAEEAKSLFQRQKLKNCFFELEVPRGPSSKRKQDEIQQKIDECYKKFKDITSSLSENEYKQSAANVTAPWRSIEYSQQISKKKSAILSVLSKVTATLRREIRHGGLQWLDNLQQKPCCRLEQIVEMPNEERVRNFYRNKNEFTVGYNYNENQGNMITVGFSLGLFREGEIRVDSVTEDCITTSKKAIRIANFLETFIRNSKLSPYDKRTHLGFWRHVIIREGFRTGESIAIIQVQTEGFEPESVNSEIDRLVECIQRLEDDMTKLDGLLLQKHNGISNVVPTNSDIQILFGKPFFHEELMGLTFRVGPHSFFQTNTFAAERLLEQIMKMAELNESSTVLDLCCGTGTIGLCLASKVGQVIGIESVEEAVEDAKYNACLNNVQNVTFLCGQVEEKLKTAIEKSRFPNIIAIADPPRAGLHPSVIKTLRNAHQIGRLVYVSCNPSNLIGNSLGFCRPKSNAFKGDPFQPIQAVAVDMFPYTEHIEVVVLFQRSRNAVDSSSEIPRKK